MRERAAGPAAATWGGAALPLAVEVVSPARDRRPPSRDVCAPRPAPGGPASGRPRTVRVHPDGRARPLASPPGPRNPRVANSVPGPRRQSHGHHPRSPGQIPASPKDAISSARGTDCATLSVLGEELLWGAPRRAVLRGRDGQPRSACHGGRRHGRWTRRRPGLARGQVSVWRPAVTEKVVWPLLFPGTFLIRMDLAVRRTRGRPGELRRKRLPHLWVAGARCTRTFFLV